ncbi:MAG TPA: DUF3224 domain-containing protein [Candidatus Limnocylindrales bacterium]|nr:DUF3224 domain-containing protein [Candidatus Limnocylindrales bacterium]
MAQRSKGIFEIAGWDENTYQELSRGGKLTEAKVSQKFTGDIEGEGSVIWLMAYNDPKTARFVGMQRIVGTIAGQKGTFLMTTDGVFDGATAKGTWSIIEGSGTEALAGISGEGSFEAPHGSKAEYSLEYDLAASPARR